MVTVACLVFAAYNAFAEVDVSESSWVIHIPGVAAFGIVGTTFLYLANLWNFSSKSQEGSLSPVIVVVSAVVLFMLLVALPGFYVLDTYNDRVSDRNAVSDNIIMLLWILSVVLIEVVYYRLLRFMAKKIQG